MAERKARQGTTPAKRNARAKRPPVAAALPLPPTSDDLYNRVAQRAYELFMQRGAVHGCDVEDWLTAERLVQEELRHGRASDAVAVQDG